MLLYELFIDGQGDNFPTLPLFNIPGHDTAGLLGLSDTPPMRWADVCESILFSPAAYRPVRSFIADAPNTQLVVESVIESVALKNYYRYKSIRDAIAAQYNPIENYNMVETSTADHTEQPYTTTNEYGAQTRTLTRDPYTDTTSIGAGKETTTLGGGTDTSETPQIKTETARGKASTKTVDAPNTSTTTNTHSVMGYDSTTFRNDTQDTTENVNPERTQTTTADAVTDTETTAPITVTNTTGQRENVIDTAARTDTVNYGDYVQNDNTGEHTDTVSTTERKNHDSTELTRSGNIGVTTTQQMLEQEILLRQKTEYIDVLARDITNALTIGVFGIGGY